jgi:hypothetical protein
MSAAGQRGLVQRELAALVSSIANEAESSPFNGGVGYNSTLFSKGPGWKP